MINEGKKYQSIEVACLFRYSGKVGDVSGVVTNGDPSEILHNTTLVNDQLDVQFLYSIIRLLQSSTCFEQRCAHHKEVKFYKYSIWYSHSLGGRPVCRLRNSFSTCIPDGHSQRVTIPDAVLIQFDLLMMSTTLLETCRGL